MSDRFEACMTFVRRWEGGKVDDPKDRGGRTAYGVTQRTYDSYRRGRGLPLQDVWHSTTSEQDEIYREMYWQTAGCNFLPEPLDLLVFDSAVQHGPSRAKKFLQQAIGVPADGVIGPRTMQALQEAVTHERVLDVAEDFLSARKDFYAAIIEHDPAQSRFEKGWMNRVAALKVEAAGFA